MGYLEFRMELAAYISLPGGYRGRHALNIRCSEEVEGGDGTEIITDPSKLAVDEEVVS